MTSAPRILLIRLSAIGDVIHALHALAALKAARPEAHVGFLVEDRAASLIEGHPDIDMVHVYRRKDWQESLLTSPTRVVGEAAKLVRELRSCRYEVAVDFQGNLKGGVLARLSGAPRRIGLAAGFGKEGNHRFQTEWVEPGPDAIHRVDRALALVAPLGANGRRGTLRVAVRPGDAAAMDEFLAVESLADGRFALLHPGTSRFGLHKRWPASRFGELAMRLAAERDLRSVVTWGPGEEGLAREAVEGSGGAAVAGPRTPRLTALARLAERAAVVVAADTGALHLAALIGTPTLGLFGPKDPAVYGPRGARAAVVTKGVDCSPCSKRSCPDPVCMKSITVEDVVVAISELLSGSPAAGGKRGT